MRKSAPAALHATKVRAGWLAGWLHALHCLCKVLLQHKKKVTCGMLLTHATHVLPQGAPRKPRAPKRQQPGSPRAGLTINTSRQRSFSEGEPPAAAAAPRTSALQPHLHTAPGLF